MDLQWLWLMVVSGWWLWLMGLQSSENLGRQQEIRADDLKPNSPWISCGKKNMANLETWKAWNSVTYRLYRYIFGAGQYESPSLAKDQAIKVPSVPVSTAVWGCKNARFESHILGKVGAQVAVSLSIWKWLLKIYGPGIPYRLEQVN